MSTDDVTEMHGPCVCGKGEIVVIATSPDHPWAKDHQTSYSAEIRCEDCSREYAVLQEYGNQRPRLVLRSELELRYARTAEADAAKEALDASPEVEALIARLAARVDQEPSMAAKFRLLNSHQLVYESLGTFRKNFRGIAHWARYGAGARNILNILALLGEDNPALAAEATRFKELSDLANAHIRTAARPMNGLGQ